ncbi:hypothetical protein [Kineococcus sp. SYSU DK005]|uniref:hypothetical protein n=1 Tax=Kineococcus sp. SYSU DK005 TaxID=3383126 RepID=UPI003D7C661D
MSGTGGPAGGDPLPPEEERVRQLLRAAAGTAGPMPADVVARVEEALARARADLGSGQDAGIDAGQDHGRSTGGARVASLAHHRENRAARAARWRRGLVAVAAAGVLAAGLGALVQQGGSSGPGSSGAGSSAADGPAAATSGGAPAAAPVLSSDADYADEAALLAAGAALLQGPAQTGGEPERDTLAAPAAPAAPAAVPDESRRPAAERALGCAAALGVDPASVSAVEVAAWRAQPAALVVRRTGGSSGTGGTGGEVVVVALGCTPGQPALARVALPAQPPPGAP